MDRHDIARAFSGHDFAPTFEHLADDVTWTIVGNTVLHGQRAVRAACEETAAENVGVTTTWRRFVSTGDGDIVAVDAIGQYDGPDGVSAVASCDIYEFTDERVSAITSYAVEVPVEAPAGGDGPANPQDDVV